MLLKNYFEAAAGTGVLATADNGDNGVVAFIMREYLMDESLQSNPFAAYLFMDNGFGIRACGFFSKRPGKLLMPG